MEDVTAAPVQEAGSGPALDGIVGAFERTADAGVVERRFELLGLPVLIRFARGALGDELSRAFAHLAADDAGDPAFTVGVWETAVSGGEPPPLPDGPSPDDPFGALYLYSGDGVRVAHQPGPNILSAFDAGRSEAWYWVDDARHLPYWDAAAPLRQILHWWAAEQGCQLVHGAAVGTEDGGVLLVGRGGSGKSTAALSSLESELFYAADDYVAVELEPAPRVHSLFSSGKVEPHHAHRLPHVAAAVSNADRLDTEKAVVFAHEHFPERTTAGFPLAAVILPRVTGGAETRIVPASRAAALAALAPSTIFQLHPPSKQALSTMARLVQRVPAFVLESGSDIPGIPRAIAGLLEELGAAR